MDYILLLINNVGDDLQRIHLGTGFQTCNRYPTKVQINSFIVQIIKTVEYTIHWDGLLQQMNHVIKADLMAGAFAPGEVYFSDGHKPIYRYSCVQLFFEFTLECFFACLHPCNMPADDCEVIILRTLQQNLSIMNQYAANSV